MSTCFMKKIGFITSVEDADLYYDDKYLIEPFLESGIEIVPVIWDQYFDYNSVDLLIFRSAWDYHHKVPKFQAWLNQLETISSKVWNPPSIIQQNYDKFYLKELNRSGVFIIPTLFYPSVKEVDLQQILIQHNWEKGVIKPAISMSAYQTYSFSMENAAILQQELINNYGNTKVIIQQFSEAIVKEGEWSLVFFNKKYCFSVLKSPKAGDFRVQSDFGGTHQIIDPSEKIIAQAKAILDQYEEPLLYARVDGVQQDGNFQLMELELIDPELYFRYGEKVRKAFLEAIRELLF